MQQTVGLHAGMLVNGKLTFAQVYVYLNPSPLAFYCSPSWNKLLARPLLGHQHPYSYRYLLRLY